MKLTNFLLLWGHMGVQKLATKNECTKYFTCYLKAFTEKYKSSTKCNQLLLFENQYSISTISELLPAQGKCL